jgi:hypothetical protein
VAPKIIQLAIPDIYTYTEYQETPKEDFAVGILGRILKAAILEKGKVKQKNKIKSKKFIN